MQATAAVKVANAAFRADLTQAIVGKQMGIAHVVLHAAPVVAPEGAVARLELTSASVRRDEAALVERFNDAIVVAKVAACVALYLFHPVVIVVVIIQRTAQGEQGDQSADHSGGFGPLGAGGCACDSQTAQSDGQDDGDSGGKFAGLFEHGSAPGGQVGIGCDASRLWNAMANMSFGTGLPLNIAAPLCYNQDADGQIPCNVIE